MSRIKYVDNKFKHQTLELIERANEIIEEYIGQGYDLTLRQLYYQFVSRDAFPDMRKWRWTGSRWVRDVNGTKNAEPNYKWLGGVVNDARLSGLIDWDCMVDRTRNLQRLSHWDSPHEMVSDCVRGFNVDLWEHQKYRPEVWIEKDALIGVIESVCDENDVPFFSCRGYTSQSEMWRASQRMDRYMHKGQTPIVLHLGDHDPSGIDMSRDISERIQETFKVKPIEFRRLALNMKQIKKAKPPLPPSPAKITDSRAVGYIAKHGDQSWELDALEPSFLVSLIFDALKEIRDEKQYKKDLKRRDAHRQDLKGVSDNWNKIIKNLNKKPKRKKKNGK